MHFHTFSIYFHRHIFTALDVPTNTQVQGDAEPTDTFQMFTDNIWKQGKISETVYKYVPVRYLLPTYYKRIF